jgi:hypothetical protein
MKRKRKKEKNYCDAAKKGKCGKCQKIRWKEEMC